MSILANIELLEYHLYWVCAATSNCAALQYNLKCFIFVSGNNFNCTAPSNSIILYVLQTIITSVFIPEVFSQSYSTIVLYSRDVHEWWVWSTKKSTYISSPSGNHSQPLDSISQEKTNPKLYAFREIQNATNEFLQGFKILFLREFSTALLTALLTHPLTDAFSQA